MNNKLLNFFIMICIISLSFPIFASFEYDISQRQSIAKNYKHLKARAEQGELVRVIVKLKRDDSLSSRKESLSEKMQELKNRFSNMRLEPQRELKQLGLMVYEVDADQLDSLIDSGLIEQLQEDTLSKPLLAQSIPFVRADIAHNYGYRGNNQAVVILDTGVDTSHPFFGGRVVEEACFSTFGGHRSLCPNKLHVQTGPGAGINCSDASGCDHGTHVAGIAAGANGVAPDANLLSVQVFTRFTSSDICGGEPCCEGESSCVLSYTSNQLAALEWVLYSAATPNIAAVNISLGGGKYLAHCDSSMLKPVIDQLRNEGIATVIASGNDGFTNAVAEPGCISSAITVGSTLDSSDTISGFSNSASMVDLLAPGSSITSSIVGGGFGRKWGTSMAAPHVAGSVAVLKSVNASATVTDIERALEENGVEIIDPNNNLTFPRLDLYASTLSVENKPIARLDQASYSVRVGVETEFTAFGSSDPNNQALTYTWDFGDGDFGNQTSIPRILHTYSDAGAYALGLTVDNGVKTSDVSSASVTVYDPAVLTVIITHILL